MTTNKKKINCPNQVGQIVRFHTPYPDEDPKQLYVVMEIFVYDDESKPKANIKALNTGWSFPPVSKVFLEDLEIAEVDTTDLIGYKAAVKKKDNSIVSGRVVEVEKSKQIVDLFKIETRVESNVCLKIKDLSGNLHRGTLAVLF
jgi:exosome complex RNA-binding protein Csl4